MSAPEEPPSTLTGAEAGEEQSGVSSGLARSSAIVAAGTGASRVTGLLRLMVQGWAIGALSAYNVANTAPNLLFDLLAGGVLTATLVPVFVDNDRRRDDRATSAVWTVTTVVLLAVTVLGMALAPFIALIGQTPEDRQLYRLLLWMLIPQVLFYGLTTLASSTLNARRRFAAAAFAPVVNNVVAIAVLAITATQIPTGTSQEALPTLLLDRPLLLAFLGLGTTVGIVAQAAALWPALRRAGVRIHRRFDVRDPAVGSVLRLSGWMFAYVATNQAAIGALIVLTEVANPRIGPAAYTVSYLFFQLPYGVLAASIITAAVPELASLVQGDRVGEFRDRILGAIRLTVLLTLPVAVTFAVLARPIIGAFFEYRNFDAEVADLSAEMLQAFSVGIVFFSVYLLAVRSFYAARDTKRPFLVNLVESAMQIGIGLALMPALGAVGLALGFSVAYVIGAGIVLWVLTRRFGALPWRRHLVPLAKITTAGAATGVVLVVVARAVGGDTGAEAFVRIAVALVAGAATYLAALAALRVPDVGDLLRAFRRS